MNEQVGKYLKPVKTFWGKQSKKKKITFISVLLGILLISVILVLILNTKQYAVLFSGISQEEAVEVTKMLNEQGTEYKAENGGTTILVDKQKEAIVRMQMSNAGHPRTAPNYDFFKSNVDFMTTESEKRTFKIYQLQERLKASIETIQGVKQAIVTISAPEDNGWAWEEDKLEATASVTLTLVSGSTLEPTQVNGIKKLVATSVPGLKAEKIAVVDSTGNELKSSDSMTYVDINNFKLDIENKFQNDVRNNIMRSIAPVYGEENITVTAKSTMSLDKKIKEIISNTPSTEDDKGIITESTVDKGAIKPQEAGGVPGTETNSDLPNYVGVADDGKTIYYKDYSNYKYAVNKITEQITTDAAQLQDLTVSVLINKKERLLNEEDSESVKRVIANAAGVSPAKVEVYNPEFKNTGTKPLDETPGGILENKVFIFSMSAAAMLLLIGLIVVFLINRKLKKRRNHEEVLEIGEQMNITIPQEKLPNMTEDLKNVPESKEQVLKKEIKEFSSNNPEIVAQLLRTWLKGDDDNA